MSRLLETMNHSRGGGKFTKFEDLNKIYLIIAYPQYANKFQHIMSSTYYQKNLVVRKTIQMHIIILEAKVKSNLNTEQEGNVKHYPMSTSQLLYNVTT